MDNDTLFRNKITDAANRSFRQNIYTYTNFLDLNELSVFSQMKDNLNFVSYRCFGGAPDCERQIWKISVP